MSIWSEATHMLDIRGWGYLTGQLKLNEQDAIQAQVDFGNEVTKRYNQHGRLTEEIEYMHGRRDKLEAEVEQLKAKADLVDEAVYLWDNAPCIPHSKEEAYKWNEHRHRLIKFLKKSKQLQEGE